MLADPFVQAAQGWLHMTAHAHVVQAHYVEIIAQQPLLFVEYVSGGKLSDWIGLPRLTHDLPQVIRYAVQVCDAMLHAQAQGITAHRDLKARNCLITPDGSLKVTDFHLAATFDGATPGAAEVPTRPLSRLHPGQTGTLAGSCTHMAPELFETSSTANVCTDIYAFGVLLLHMLTGKLPFTGQTWQEVAHLHRTQPPPSLNPPATVLTPLLETCLAKDPAQRCGDFGMLRDQLAAMYLSLTGTPVAQPVVGTALEVEQCNNLGTSLHSLGRHHEALVYYDRALALENRHALTWVHRGTALEALGRTDDALACCDHALHLNAQSEPALLAKGMLLGALGRLEEARAYCDRALKINPRNEQAWVNIGTALEALGRSVEALGCYNNALTLNPRNAQAWFNASVVLGERGRHEEALGCCERALGLDPRNAQAWVNRGLTLGELQRPEEALACFEQALLLNPRLEQAWFNKGVTLFNVLERYAEALTCFQEAERLGNTQATEGIALCQQALKAQG
jgi:tetratricopeptide (TPR) repeat protein